MPLVRSLDCDERCVHVRPQPFACLCQRKTPPPAGEQAFAMSLLNRPDALANGPRGHAELDGRDVHGAGAGNDKEGVEVLYPQSHFLTLAWLK